MFAIASPINGSSAGPIRSWISGDSRADIRRRFVRRLSGGAYVFESWGDVLALLIALQRRSNGGVDVFASVPIQEWNLPHASRAAAKRLASSPRMDLDLSIAKRTHLRCNIVGSGTSSKSIIVSARSEEAKSVLQSWRSGQKRDVKGLFRRRLKPGLVLAEARGDLLALLWALNERSGHKVDIFAAAPISIWDLPSGVKEAVECLVKIPNAKQVLKKVRKERLRCLITSRERSLESFDLDSKGTDLL